MNCDTSRRGDEVKTLYTSCECCGDNFEPWSNTPYCDGCVEHGCDDPITNSLPGCKFKKETVDPPECDDHSFYKREYSDGVECRWCGLVTNGNWSERDYGPEWDGIREKAITRDNSKCVSCGMGRDEHRDEYGEDLHVHHKKPLRLFKSREEAHQLDNLDTLCKACHLEREWAENSNR